MSVEELQAHSPHITDDVNVVLGLEAALAAKDSTGGTAPDRVAEALKKARKYLEQ